MAALARVFSGSRFLTSSAATGAKKSVGVAAGAQVTKADATAAKAKRGIMQPVPVSDALRKFAGGTPEVSRAGAVKLVWAHIKAHGLQNPANKREINCDEKLKSLFGGRDKIGMMEVTKLLSPHFVKN
ncbi:upstream activation factor subunit UAF30-like [Phragmites australis]|uniref:upstream activation factor subunit UAF30-like n=1 Tax=Phragmites australis TaxID=29695 RepID=UPI002D78C968|nr:upstream activation factor subunit UAF30-like [Phragmites australis]